MPLHLYVSVVSYLAVPCFVALAYRDSTKRTPESLSNWRSKLGLAAMLVISADWSSVIFLIVAERTNLRWARFIDDSWLNYLSLAPIVATFLAVILKGRARIWTVAAGLAMGLFWATSWVE